MTYNCVDHICQLEEIYIRPEFRRQGKASYYYKMMEGIAKEHNCDCLLGSIVIGTNNAEESMQCLFTSSFSCFFQLFFLFTHFFIFF
ncbi:GNAT family N-acetyltransferase [Nocardia mangyaensis]|uniref:GNAT family N-acetyltransferase n=1 Tax=Nocardia mangyaensis TaxID=2213200 RepID=UPI003460AF52